MRRPPRLRPRTLELAAVAVVLCLGAALAVPLAAQPATPPSSPATQPEPPGAAAAAVPGGYVGVASCASTVCHGATAPRDGYAVLQNEYYTWQQSDRHAQAYNVLFDERSRIIARNLRIGPAHEAESCLACHALTPEPALRRARLEIEDGVTCESCHGPASGWLEGHRSDGWAYADSVEAGMADLRDPRVRAELCLSCHLGDESRGVDHRLIAAGHPALVFELDNYAAAMPPHWAPPDVRELPADHAARAWALGQVHAFRAGLEQLAHRAESGAWPEFAEMRCDSCHHALDEERWRRSGGSLGLPRWSPARWTALRPLVAAVAPGRLAELDGQVAALAEGVSALGAERREVARRARAAAAGLAAIEPQVAALEWSDERLRSLLAALAAAGGDEPGYDEAAQLLLAANSLTSELFRRRPELAASSGLVAALGALDAELERRAGFDPQRFGALRSRLETQVRRLPR